MSFASFSPEFVVHCRSPLRASLAMAIRGDATGASLWKAPTSLEAVLSTVDEVLRFEDKLLFRCAQFARKVRRAGIAANVAKLPEWLRRT